MSVAASVADAAASAVPTSLAVPRRLLGSVVVGAAPASAGAALRRRRRGVLRRPLPLPLPPGTPAPASLLSSSPPSSSSSLSMDLRREGFPAPIVGFRHRPCGFWLPPARRPPLCTRRRCADQHPKLPRGDKVMDTVMTVQTQIPHMIARTWGVALPSQWHLPWREEDDETEEGPSRQRRQRRHQPADTSSTTMEREGPTASLGSFGTRRRQPQPQQQLHVARGTSSLDSTHRDDHRHHHCRASVVGVPYRSSRVFSTATTTTTTPSDNDDDGDLVLDDTAASWNVHPDLRPYVRANLTTSPSFMETSDDNDSNSANDDQKKRKREQQQKLFKEKVAYDSGLTVTLLGTGAGGPSLERNNPATAVKMASQTYLFDAGEGVQVPLMMSRIKRSSITKIFITHLHGDHVLGLPGLILSLQVNAKARIQDPITNQRKERKHRRAAGTTIAHSHPSPTAPETRLLQIYGPEGLYELVATVFRLIHAELHYLRVEVHELVVGRTGPTPRTSLSPRFPSHSSPAPTASSALTPSLRWNLIRKVVPQDPDGTWTLETPYECTTPELAEQAPSSASGRGVYVKAAEVHHLPRLTSVGFVIREPTTQPSRIDRTKASAAGIRPGKKYERLKYGFAVPSDLDPDLTVHPHEVLVSGPKPSRSVAILGDCCDVPGPMSELCKNVDVLIHEATLKEEDASRRLGVRVPRGAGGAPPGRDLSGKAKMSGHSTAEMAGQVARRLQPKVLLLNHLSASLRDLDQAKEAEKGLVSPSNGGYRSSNPSDGIRTRSTGPVVPLESASPVSAPAASAPARTKVQVGYDHLEIVVPPEGFPW